MLLIYSLHQETKMLLIYSFQGICPPLWDNASCIPPNAGGDTAVIPCMRMYAGQYYAADSKYKYY